MTSPTPNTDTHRTSRRVRHALAAVALAGTVFAAAGAAGAVSRVPAASSSPVLVDTVKVPAKGQTVTSHISLLNGVKYTITVSGTLSVSHTGARGDAEYAVLSDGTVQDNCAGSPNTDIGVGINTTNPLSQKSPVAWGAYNSGHHYATGRVGNGNPIHFTYHDCLSSDNSGFVVARIYATA